MLSRRALIRGTVASVGLLAAPPIIRATRRLFFPHYGPMRFKEVAEDVFVVERARSGFEIFDELFGIQPAEANFTPPPNDPEYANQWHFNNTHLNVVGAWATSQGNSATVISALDTGCTLGTEYPTNVIAGVSEVPGCTGTGECYQTGSGHGSITAGMMLAPTNNSLGAAAIAPNCTFLPIVVCDSTGACNPTPVVNGITYAYGNGVHIANMSFGGLTDIGGATTAAITAAWNAGMTMAAALGDSSLLETSDLPSSHPNVLGVSGLDSANNLWVNSGVTIGSGGAGSGYGLQKIMAYSGGNAPASNKFLCLVGWKSTTPFFVAGCIGTGAVSFAVPQVTGVLGLMRIGANPNYQWLRNDELFNLVLQNTTATGTSVAYDPVNKPAPDQFYGYGRLNANSAVAAAASYVRPRPLGGI